MTEYDLKYATGLDLITMERARQMRGRLEGGEGHDTNGDRGRSEELAMAAVSYAMPAASRPHAPHSIARYPSTWPWKNDKWKPDTTGSREGRIRELTKAGALIAAAIDAERDAILRGGQ